jgi:hypothetical protein
MTRDDQTTLGTVYAGAFDVFLRGGHDRALEQFKRIYEVDCTFRDVSEIINDYYDMPSEVWIAKYNARFHGRNG